MSATLQVELFEYVPATAGTALLRLEGRWHAPGREPLPMPAMIVDDGRRSRRLNALPGPGAAPPQAGPDPDLWRASFAIEAALLDDPRIVFALDTGAGQIVDLPAAAPRGRGRRYSRSSHAELAHERTRRAAAERLADERRRALRDAEVEFDRERAARAAETMRADTAEADLRGALAELEAVADRARADAAQRAREAETAAGTLAVTQARVRELDEALAAQRRRALEAESLAATTAQEADAAVERERERHTEALAAQRAIAEEATRAKVAAEAAARDHEARALDLEIARDDLRTRLERERERLRELQAREVSELTVEERRRVRELQSRAEAAERRAAEAEKRLEITVQRTELEVGPEDEALVAEVAAQRARADEAQRQLRELAGELVEAAQDRTRLQDQLAAAHAAAEEAVALGAVAVEQQARAKDDEDVRNAGSGPTDDDIAELEHELEAERSARLRAQEEIRLAIDGRAELASRVGELEAAAARSAEEAETAKAEAAAARAQVEQLEAAAVVAEPEPEEPVSNARSLFGPFGDAGPPAPSDPPTPQEAAPHDGAPDEPAAPEEDGQATAVLIPAEPAPEPDRFERHDDVPHHRPPRWDIDEFDRMTFDHPDDDLSGEWDALPPAAVPARRRATSRPAAQASEVSVRRAAALLGLVIAVGLLLGLKLAGVLGTLTLASF